MYARGVVTADVFLVVGNGLAMDLTSQFPRLRDWNTQRPLAWQISAPGQPGVPLLDLLPRARLLIAEARAVIGGTASDFEIFDAALQAAARDSNPTMAIVELRHLVALSFAAYQKHSDRFVTAASWAWGQFILSIADRLQGIVSYNYDLNVETVLEVHGVPLRHLAVSQASGTGLPIIKPHGSIDYAPASIVFGGQRPNYPIQVFVEKCDVPIQRLPRYHLQVARYAADVVIPTEASGYSQFQWVKPGRLWARRAGTDTRTLILMGLSYWPVDRPELDELIDSVPATATVIVGNPAPHADLIDRLEARFSNVIEWRTGPQSLP